MPYKDKNLQREAQKRHYLKNKNKYLESSRKNRDKREVWFYDLKSKHKCINCGFDDIRCLDFHHRNPETKKFTISDAVAHGYSESRILTEIDKCDILCNNCHCKLHWRQKDNLARPYIDNVVKWLREYKQNLACLDCQINDPMVLCFHHTNPLNKIANVYYMASHGWAIDKVRDEITKCEVLCRNCHSIRHNGFRGALIGMPGRITSPKCEPSYLSFVRS